MRLLALSALFAVVATAPFAYAGEGRSLAGCDCANECPLAQTVNERRSTGEEAVLASRTVRAEVVRTVVKNLATI